MAPPNLRVGAPILRAPNISGRIVSDQDESDGYCRYG